MTKPNQPDKDGQITKVDILALEIDKKLPHWLSPQAKYSHLHDAQRRAKHQQYMAEKYGKKPKT